MGMASSTAGQIHKTISEFQSLYKPRIKLNIHILNISFLGLSLNILGLKLRIIQCYVTNTNERLPNYYRDQRHH
ncbi:unnamed protein product [Rhizophagus irregularis]|nr:unnamed protein product [Rhizophagus irregularis]